MAADDDFRQQLAELSARVASLEATIASLEAGTRHVLPGNLPHPRVVS